MGVCNIFLKYIDIKKQKGECAMNQRTVRIFDKQANTYEKRRRNLQQAKDRSRLLKSAYGNVLEASVGAGNNFPFYPREVHVTAVDISPKMIEKARIAAKECGIAADFIISDLERLDFDDNAFDTIVSTLSLCAYENPEYVLKQFCRWIKPGGAILMIEHGISTNSVFAWLQNRLDGMSVSLFGCHQNRDILKLVQTAGIEIVHMERMMYNSVCLIKGTVK